MGITFSEQATDEVSKKIYFNPDNQPTGFCEFVGQKEALSCIKTYCRAAKKRNEYLDHILIVGKPGLGKATLAHTISTEMDAKMASAFSDGIQTPGDLVGALTNLNDGDILFFEEIQSLVNQREIRKILELAMDQFVIDLVLGKGPSANMIHLDIPHFTLIATTSDDTFVNSSLASHFGAIIHLRDYQRSELAALVELYANKWGIAIDEDSPMLIAEACSGTPRGAQTLLRRVRDFAQVYHENVVHKELTTKAIGLICG